VEGSGTAQPDAPDAERDHLQAEQAAAPPLQGHRVQQHEIEAELPAAAHTAAEDQAFVVVQEIAATVQDGPAREHLDRHRVVRRVPVHGVDPGLGH
jgi:hypothetical protein